MDKVCNIWDNDCMETENQTENSQPKTEHLKPWQFKKGQSGNPAGRPKGQTLKEYCRDFLATQTEDERREFLEGIPKEVIWKMAEGNPKQETEGEISLRNYVITEGDFEDKPLESTQEPEATH